jgi:hypothetical protein
MRSSLGPQVICRRLDSGSAADLVGRGPVDLLHPRCPRRGRGQGQRQGRPDPVALGEPGDAGRARGRIGRRRDRAASDCCGQQTATGDEACPRDGARVLDSPSFGQRTSIAIFDTIPTLAFGIHVL